MGWMTDLYPTIGFDCASEREIAAALPLVNPNKIIYAQPCKKVEDIKSAAARGITLTVADSLEEIEKMAKAGWSGKTLVRLLVSDVGSKQPFGKKFGAPHAWLPSMFDAAKYHGINITGFSFHVGSECQHPQQYRSAIADVAFAANIASNYRFNTEAIDIGGGFLHTEGSFIETAAVINKAKQDYFPDPSHTWIAEPGRFLAAPTHTLYTTVIGIKPCWPPPQSAEEPENRITIDESVYGSFSNIPFDHQKANLERVRPLEHGEVLRPTTVFGRTCDSGDLLGTHILLPNIVEGDQLRAADMGAYTTVTASEFNGFPKADPRYID